ncbi:DUF1772 domain-containing protein [Paracoccus aerodenitrificans]|uniref:anthrone oxygenase family protein n=1 Tax=Paracoccus aerodenitrificans TaxID=3017781 RepID=UPI0022F0C2A1|nr:DUF1772 domain-containing protein [Paracoccus aerodenitrificans]WBU63049.1 DUF1772 domain-containing protein [Paracoccus aerodenitrificans]
MRLTTITVIFLALLLNAAVFGFFYAWVCSTMWGLDRADPRTAIAAMQAMNASVRNIVFFPAFFLTPVALAAAAILLRSQNGPSVAFGIAAAVYLFGGLILTMTVNVPMNEALAVITPPQDMEEAEKIWRDYSRPWQLWNQLRTVFSGLSFLIALYGVWLIDRARL